MKATKYKHHLLAHNSDAYKLWQLWQASKAPKDQAKLDKHLKEVEQRAKDLVERYK